MSHEVISIDKGRGNQTPIESPRSYATTGAMAATLPAVFVRDTDTLPLESSRAPLSIQQLYPEQIDESRLLKALNLIERARECLVCALNFDPTTEFVQFDQEIMRARAIFLKAFM